MVKKGDRVGAIQSIGDDTVYFFGYGAYQGESIPPKEVGGLNFGFPVPEIKLDTGIIVYGCECWWGSEEYIQKELAKYKHIVNVEPKRGNKKEVTG